MADCPNLAITGLPEYTPPAENWFERYAANTVGRAWNSLKTRTSGYRDIIGHVNAHADAIADLDTDQLRHNALLLKSELRRSGYTPEIVGRVFALVREAAVRTVDMRHYDVQLVAGYALLSGVIAEMETGEGKTLAATLPAVTAALAGNPVHIITVNDYLAGRDARQMQPLYAALGLSVGVIEHDMDRDGRRKVYACDITYCSNKEVTFDYLRDRVVLGQERNQARLQLERLYRPSSRLDQLVMRGLYFAIVDEADSVLIDEARTPLILSRECKQSGEEEVYRQALQLAEQLAEGADYSIDMNDHTVTLTPAGELQVAQAATDLGGIWQGTNRTLELLRLALAALHIFTRGKHYEIKDDKVQIIDEYTGRMMPDRSWEGGLHQLIEVKEGCEITGKKETLARMSYQRFFRRYHHLSGMTGTASEVAGEFWSVYRLPVVRVPTHRPLKRRSLRNHVFPSAERKWQAVLGLAGELVASGRPVLIGTRSVRDSEVLAQLFAAAGVDHVVLNALQDQHEADIVSEAGISGRVTIATNMAGRGTDIRLDKGVEPLGGLHVICTERHDAGRIDRQLFGRCGRQGDAGSYNTILSLEDELPGNYLPAFGQQLCRLLLGMNFPFSESLVQGLIVFAQNRAQRSHSRVRRDLLRMDEKIDTALAFTGRPE